MPVHVSWDYSKSALIPRHCSRCRHNWSYNKAYRSAGSDIRVINVPTEEGIKNGLEAEITRDLEHPVTNVFCPKCGEMARETIEKIFTNGFKKGLVQLYKGTLPDFFIKFVGVMMVLSLSVLFGVFGYMETPDMGGWGYIIKVVFLLIHWFCSLVILYFLYYGFLKIVCKKKVVAAINSLTEEEAYQIIKENMAKDIQGGFGMVDYLCPEELRTRKFYLDRFLTKNLKLREDKRTKE